MRHHLLFALFLLASTHSAQAQCDPKEYTRIFNEASSLQEKGAFIDAKNRYEAAKIYACLPKDTKAADDAVDALFEQIDRLLMLADSTSEANRRQALTAYAKDLAYKSKIALNDGDRTAAFKIAEFAYRYVDSDNLNVTSSLMEAIYRNDLLPGTPHAWLVQNLVGHSDAVTSIAFSPDGKNLSSWSSDNSIKIWDLKSNNSTRFGIWNSEIDRIEYPRMKRGEEHRPRGIIIIGDFSPNCKRFALPSDSIVEIYNLEEREKELTLDGHKNGVSGIRFSPDGNRIATVSGDGIVKIWDIKSGKVSIQLKGFNNAVSFSPDSRRFAIGDYNSLEIWDLEIGKLIVTIKCGLKGVKNVTFSPDGKSIAAISEAGYASIWDLTSGKETINFSSHTGPIMSVAFSPDGKKIATGSMDKTVKIWDLESGKETLVLLGHTSGILSLAFSPPCKSDPVGGNRLASGSYDNTVKIWDLDSGNEGLVLEGHSEHVSSIAFSPVCSDDTIGGRWLATGSSDNTIKLWDLSDGKEILTLDCDSTSVTCVAFSPDCKKLASGNWGHTATIWDLKNKEILYKLEGEGDGTVTSVAFSPDGKRLGMGTSMDGTPKVWDVERGIEDSTFNGPLGLGQDVTFSSDGKMFITCSPQSDEVKIWDLTGEKKIITLDLGRNSSGSIALSKSGKKLATGTSNGMVKIWDIQKGRGTMSLLGHTEYIRSVAFSPNEKCLATASQDGTTKIWDLENGKSIISLKGNTMVDFSPDGKRLATLPYGNSAIIWDLTLDGWLATPTGRTRHLACLTVSQLATYGLEALLDQHPNNESKLISTQETWQIKAFADLAASQAEGSNILSRVEPHYARADRLYAAALALQDELLIRMDYAKMLRRWAEVYQSDGLSAKATELTTKADALYKK